MIKELDKIIKNKEWAEQPDKLLGFYMSTFIDFKQYFVKYK
jgi:hypothetical protein